MRTYHRRNWVEPAIENYIDAENRQYRQLDNEA